MLRSSLLKFIMGDFSVGLVEIGFTWMEKWIGLTIAKCSTGVCFGSAAAVPISGTSVVAFFCAGLT